MSKVVRDKFSRSNEIFLSNFYNLNNVMFSMRKSVPFLIFLFFYLSIVNHCIAQSNPVPNPSFENWKGSGRPDGWSPVVEGIPLDPIFKSTDAHSGSFAVAGTPEEQGPGDFQPPQLTTTFPLNFRPASFEGWYKFATVGADGDGDVLRFQVLLFSKAKMIGTASWADSIPTTEYKQFISTIIYSDTAVPDSATILFHTTDFRGFYGSYSSQFIVDDLALTNYTTPTAIQSVVISDSANLNAGSSATISWASIGSLPDSINIDVSYDASQTWTPIQHGIDTSVHSYDWTVPNISVTGAIIRISSGNEVAYSSPFNIATSGVAKTKVLSGFTLTPNPTLTNASLLFDLTSSASVNLTLYDPLGKEVYRSNLGTVNAGPHDIQLNASKLTPGIYLCRLSTDRIEQVIKLVVQR
jgi:hypothetical protein